MHAHSHQGNLGVENNNAFAGGHAHYAMHRQSNDGFAPPPPLSSMSYGTGFARPAPAVPQAVQPMPPLTAQPDAPPVKRPRGRPRKVPGTESRPASLNQGARGRPGRPRGSRGRGRGRGATRGRGRRGHDSSDEDGGEEGSSDSDDERGGSGSVNLQEEMPDDVSSSRSTLSEHTKLTIFARQYDPTPDSGAPTTKSGRKISRPKSFVPTNRPTSELLALQIM